MSVSLAMVLIAVDDRRPLAKVLIAVAALASVSVTHVLVIVMQTRIIIII
jgi:hypothetical protein